MSSPIQRTCRVWISICLRFGSKTLYTVNGVTPDNRASLLILILCCLQISCNRHITEQTVEFPKAI